MLHAFFRLSLSDNCNQNCSVDITQTQMNGRGGGGGGGVERGGGEEEDQPVYDDVNDICASVSDQARK